MWARVCPIKQHELFALLQALRGCRVVFALGTPLAAAWAFLSDCYREKRMYLVSSTQALRGDRREAEEEGMPKR